MRVRTFRASTVSEALKAVRKELGPEAIILNIDRISDADGGNIVEVRAAIENKTISTPILAGVCGFDSSDIRSELNEVKSFLSTLISSKDYLTGLHLKQPIAEVYHSLLVRGLDERYAYIFLSKVVSSGAGGEHLNKRDLLNALCKQLLRRIKVCNPFSNLPTKAQCFTFVGPTGVGKTTTLAKLAALLKFKYRMTVAVISIDTYRIGAVEQLGTYTDILELPFLVVQTREELQHARKRFEKFDVILVDTVGKNYLDRRHIEGLREMFNCPPNGYHHFLVLSATAKDHDLAQTIKNFVPLSIGSLVFTKIDETLNHGCIINQLIRFGRPVSYLGIGQRVPEDIAQANQKQVLTLLFPSIGKEGE